MKVKSTQFVCDPMFTGDKLYQKRARQVMPLLVRQATVQKSVYYKELAAEMGMPNARNLNFVLGSVGATLDELNAKWGEKIPHIQSLVINKGSGLPGSGFFGGKDKYTKLTKMQRDAFIRGMWTDIFAYPKWDQVLKSLDLAPAKPKLEKAIEGARQFYGGGESPQHKRFKNAIAANPTLVNLSPKCMLLNTEYRLPSGDAIDVCFAKGIHLYAVEVKSRLSGTDDIARGLFQCVKYQAILDVWRNFEGNHGDVIMILALETRLPAELIPLRNALQVKVIDGIKI